jgi:hypothetical protein
VQEHGARLDEALAALADSRAVDDARLRNLAPALDVSPLHGI